MVIQWDLDAWEDYLYWQSQDKKILKKINQLVKDIISSPFERRRNCVSPGRYYLAVTASESCS